MLHAPHTYAELQKEIHDELRVQHPEWIQSNGECPMCDSYEARLTVTLDALRSIGPENSCGRDRN